MLKYQRTNFYKEYKTQFPRPNSHARNISCTKAIVHPLWYPAEGSTPFPPGTSTSCAPCCREGKQAGAKPYLLQEQLPLLTKQEQLLPEYTGCCVTAATQKNGVLYAVKVTRSLCKSPLVPQEHFGWRLRAKHIIGEWIDTAQVNEPPSTSLSSLSCETKGPSLQAYQVLIKHCSVGCLDWNPKTQITP